MENQLTIKSFFSRTDVRQKFEEMLGKRAPQFITSVLQIANSNAMLQKADPASIYNAAAVAATLDLPLNNSLGFAFIVPYNVKQSDGTYKAMAQFQISYRGLIQLAQRSGQFLTISAAPIYEGQLIEEDPLKGFVFDFKAKKSDTVIGYAAYFKLLNGFEKSMYMTIAELKRHGKKFSKTFDKSNGLWQTDFEVMASKTVLKLLLSKFGPLSVEIQKAVVNDQAVINDLGEPEYVDHEEVIVNKVQERAVLLLNDCKTLDDLKKIEKEIPDELIDLYIEKKDQLSENNPELFSEKVGKGKK